jgi:chlorobactene glucosyltransferase
VLPVRNEQEHLDACLASLLAQDYPRFEVIVVDDGSTDATPALLAAWARRDPRVRVQRIETLPAGWAGKAHALHTGASLARGEWLLFTDADTRHAPHTLRRMVAHACVHGLDFASMLPDARIVGPGGRLLTPVGVVLMTQFGTPAEMRDARKPGRALAVGQYMLIRRAAYMASGGYGVPALRATFGDDVALAQFLKRQGCREDFVDGRGLVFNEQWTTWRSAWQGWRKSVYSVVAPAPWLGLGGGLALIAFGLVPLLTLIGQLLRPRRLRRQTLTTLAALLTLVLQIQTRRLIDREQGLPLRWSLTTPFGWVAFGLLLLDATRLALSGRAVGWKGRTAPRQPLAIALGGAAILAGVPRTAEARR